MAHSGPEEAKGSQWLDAVTLLARRPNFGLAQAAVYFAIDSELLQYGSSSEENRRHC